MTLPSKCPSFLPNILHRLLEETYREPPFAKWLKPQEQAADREVDGSVYGLFQTRGEDQLTPPPPLFWRRTTHKILIPTTGSRFFNACTRHADSLRACASGA